MPILIEDDLRALYAAPAEDPALERAVIGDIRAAIRARARLRAWQGALLLAAAAGSAASGAYIVRAIGTTGLLASSTPLAPANLLAAG